MAISYATLIDVARVNGLPLPELFPVLVDVGTVATMIAAAQFRLRGVNGRWLAYATFIALSAVSIVANSTHAWRAADMTVTTPWAAALLAATPPAALLAITHLVMLLVPDEKERAKLQAARERAQQEPQVERRAAPTPQPNAVRAVPALATPNNERYEPAPSTSTTKVEKPTQSKSSDQEVQARVLAHIQETGKRPTGATVGVWLGQTPKSGQRFMKRLEEEGVFDPAPKMQVVREGLQNYIDRELRR
ncbi:hypothetical protein QBL02_03625 [Leucobacter sp. UT-8R-CII-1-4]|uniref:hypothetical protein n=1 Tax=Leucobacter sp. UT-8R-CII-1-4 TaxID=3040075 RepID=UPI0024A9CBC3|nr:hypothetical protein [Leucobacter sp. UT-8R-CII-1-4]MDI6022629.1 hypothetical protein [Leucobacter sp. UT-8R-CII-1-4]